MLDGIAKNIFGAAFPYVLPVSICHVLSHESNLTITDWMVYWVLVGISILWGYIPVVYIAVRQYRKIRSD
jgi:hypothetical protein